MPVRFVPREPEVVRGEDRVEREPSERLEVRRGRSHAMARDPDRADQTLLARSDGALDRASRPGRAVEIFEVADRVELDQVDPIHLEALERSPDAVVRPGRGPVAGLRRQEDPTPDPSHPSSEVHFRVAVGRGGVEVVDARVDRELDRAIGDLVGDVDERRAAVDEHRGHVPESSQWSCLHLAPPQARAMARLGLSSVS